MPADIHLPWDELERRFERLARTTVADRLALGEEHRMQTVRFAVGRLDEGKRIGEFFLRRAGRRIRCLDVGAGDGGVSAGLANYTGITAVACDLSPSAALSSIRTTGAEVGLVSANGYRLPFRDETFDAVACLEVIEHVPEPERFGAEVMRVLKPGGICMITTPARLRHLFGPDPHFGVRALLALPDGLQRARVLGAARRRFGQVDPSLYDVSHIFWSSRGVTSCFQPAARVEVMLDTPSRWGAAFRRAILWSRIVVEKRA